LAQKQMATFLKSMAALTLAASFYATAQTAPVGEIKGDAWAHTKDSLAALVQQADVCLPASATGAGVVCRKFKDLPNTSAAKPVPTVVFLHGSSGLALQAIGQWQQWLATLGFASIAPDSFALPGRVTYKSPIDKPSYERIHALRASEIEPTLAALSTQAWADNNRLILAGTSEGAVPVARHTGTQFVARIMYAWSCEQNYFVAEPRNAFEPKKPVLNIISVIDPFFSKTNTWIGNADAQGHCATALKDNSAASIALIPNAPHTLLNLPAARHATAGFLAALFVP
jgi:dienelactone hydrolase